MHVGGRQRGRERDREREREAEAEADSVLISEPNVGLDLMIARNQESDRCFTD